MQGLSQDLDGVQDGTTGPHLDLRATGDAAGHYLSRVGVQSIEEGGPHGDRELGILGLVAEGANHAAAQGLDLAHRHPRNEADGLPRSRPDAKGLLVTVAVDDELSRHGRQSESRPTLTGPQDKVLGHVVAPPLQGLQPAVAGEEGGLEEAAVALTQRREARGLHADYVAAVGSQSAELLQVGRSPGARLCERSLAHRRAAAAGVVRQYYLDACALQHLDRGTSHLREVVVDETIDEECRPPHWVGDCRRAPLAEPSLEGALLIAGQAAVRVYAQPGDGGAGDAGTHHRVGQRREWTKDVPKEVGAREDALPQLQSELGVVALLHHGVQPGDVDHD